MSSTPLSTFAIIPARMGSTRFAGKPLHPLCGIPMIGHVALRTALCTAVDAVYVATCDEVIATYCQKIGVKVVMTSEKHVRCTDRCAEALPLIEALEGRKAQTVVVVQGDEPLVHPHMLHAALQPLQYDASVQVVNLMAAITQLDEFMHPNTIKVVTDMHGRALYFSRQPLPYSQVEPSAQGSEQIWGYKQVCIMPFRREALFTFISLPETPLERVESIDMLRLLEHGYPVHMALSSHVNQSVDCLADVAKAEHLLKQDTLFSQAVYYSPNMYENSY